MSGKLEEPETLKNEETIFFPLSEEIQLQYILLQIDYIRYFKYVKMLEGSPTRLLVIDQISKGLLDGSFPSVTRLSETPDLRPKGRFTKCILAEGP